MCMYVHKHYQGNIRYFFEHMGSLNGVLFQLVQVNIGGEE
jgi:hypothetical protein